MAIIYSYPLIGELATGDTIAISDASNGNKTKSVTIGQLDSYINTGQATIIQVEDRVVTGASFNTSTGLLTLTRNSGEIPSVSTDLDGRYYLSSNPSNYTSNLGIVQSLTTENESGAATLTNGVLNIPQYSSGGGGGEGTVTSIATTAPITGGTITTTGTIGISQASTDTDGYLSSTDWSAFNAKQSTSEKGAASGYAPLDASQKVPTANLPDSLVGAVTYQGTWNADTNTPTLPASPTSETQGDYYVVSTPGTFQTIAYTTGDWIISTGSAWEKVDNTQDVNSVFGRQGNVVADANDYSAFYDANVQSDWNATGGDAFILNKPTTITQTQSNEIAANSLKTSFPGFGTTAGTALEGNTSLLQIGTTSTTALAGDTAVITGTTATQTAPTEIKTLTANEYSSETKANDVIYIIVD